VHTALCQVMLAVLICALLRCSWRHGGTIELLGLQTDDSAAAGEAHKYTAVTGQQRTSSSSRSGRASDVNAAADAAVAREGVALCCVTAAAACATVELLSGWRGPDGTHQVLFPAVFIPMTLCHNRLKY
jgi:hypothetical protein